VISLRSLEEKKRFRKRYRGIIFNPIPGNSKIRGKALNEKHEIHERIEK